MTKIVSLLFITSLILGGVTYGQSQEQKRVQNSIGVLSSTTEIPDSILKHAQAIVVLPGVTKASAGVSGIYGSGAMSVKKSDGCWSDPVFISISGTNVGKHVGGGVSDIILVFMDKKTITDLQSGELSLGQSVTVEPGPVKNGTSAKPADIYSYVKSNDKLSSTSLTGYTLKIDSKANQTYYGKNISAQQIIQGSVKNTPASVSEFTKAVGNLTGVCKK